MPRPPRILVPDGIYHVYTRGSDRKPLFLFDWHRLLFLERLAKIFERHELGCIAYCLMGNHYHAIVKTPDARLSCALQQLHTQYSRDFNRSEGRSAHLFRQRFRSRLIEGDADLLGACAYLAHNPVEAGLCGNPGDWPWSSYRASAGYQPTPAFLTDDAVGDAIGGGSDWRARYRDFIERRPFLETQHDARSFTFGTGTLLTQPVSDTGLRLDRAQPR